jgi:hypothetical protein
MDYTASNPVWVDVDHTQIDLDIGDQRVRINAIPGLLQYEGLMASGVAIAPPVVTRVTPRQARLALLAAGLLPQVEAAVKAAGGATQITWEYATEIDRNSELINTLGTQLGLTAFAIDYLFNQAATL